MKKNLSCKFTFEGIKYNLFAKLFRYSVGSIDIDNSPKYNHVLIDDETMINTGVWSVVFMFDKYHFFLNFRYDFDSYTQTFDFIDISVWNDETEIFEDYIYNKDVKLTIK